MDEVIKPESWLPVPRESEGSVVTFAGYVRGTENGVPIDALEYEVYGGMAESEIQRILHEIHEAWPVSEALVVHRRGVVRAGEIAIFVAVTSPHRTEGFEFIQEFMNRLKQDVPIWKVRAISR